MRPTTSLSRYLSAVLVASGHCEKGEKRKRKGKRPTVAGGDFPLRRSILVCSASTTPSMTSKRGGERGKRKRGCFPSHLTIMSFALRTRREKGGGKGRKIAERSRDRLETPTRLPSPADVAGGLSREREGKEKGGRTMGDQVVAHISRFDDTRGGGGGGDRKSTRAESLPRGLRMLRRKKEKRRRSFDDQALRRRDKLLAPRGKNKKKRKRERRRRWDTSASPRARNWPARSKPAGVQFRGGERKKRAIDAVDSNNAAPLLPRKGKEKEGKKGRCRNATPTL